VVGAQVGKGGGKRFIRHTGGHRRDFLFPRLILSGFIEWICETGARPIMIQTHHDSGSPAYPTGGSSAEVSLPDKYEEHEA